MTENRTIKVSAVLTPAQAGKLDELAARKNWSRSTAIAALIDQPEVNAEQMTAVLEQITGYSSDADIRDHLRQVIQALQGSGLIFLNGPPQEAMRRGEPR